MKTCTKCKVEKSFEDFVIDNSKKDGRYPSCVECRNKYLLSNKAVRLNKAKKYYLNNKKERLEYRKNYRSKNIEKITAKHTIYCLKRRKTDINFRLAINLRNRLYQALKKQQKMGSAVSDLGCSIQELKKYIEKQFQNGMSWGNWGLKGWQIDHIKPLSKFDLSNKEQFLEACHYTNLQPLWWQDNFIKGAK